jgi:PAS domain-containing protein
VFGAWLWNQKLRLGITTGVDAAEALGQFEATRIIVLILVSGTAFISLGLTGFSIWTGRSASQSLARVNAELEGRVEARTKEVASKEQQLRLILESANDAVISIDTSGTILSWNKSATNLFG